MKDLANTICNAVNDGIARGLNTEQVCGVLDVASFRVKQASVPAEAASGGELKSTKDGSPVPENLEEN